MLLKFLPRLCYICFALFCQVFTSLSIEQSKGYFRLIPRHVTLVAPSARLYLLVSIRHEGVLEVICNLTDVYNASKGTRVRREASDGHVLPSDSEDIVQEDPTSIYLGTRSSENKPETTTVMTTTEAKIVEPNLDLVESRLINATELQEANAEITTEMDTFNDSVGFPANVSDKPALAEVSKEPEAKGEAWKLLHNSYYFKQSDLLLPVDMQCNLIDDACVQGAFNVQCYGANRELYTESHIIYDIKPVNTAVEEERFYASPQYLDIAPCPCDITKEGCDMNCCCDEDCSDIAKSTFVCPAETRLEKMISENQCQSGRNGLVCVETYTVPYVGHFHKIEPIIRSVANYTRRVARTKLKSGRQTGQVRFEWRSSRYKAGDPVQVKKRYSEGMPSFWTVPRQALGSSCLNSSPVIFLENFHSACLRHLTAGFCTEELIFSVDNYFINNSTAAGWSLVLVSDPSIQTGFASFNAQFWCVKNMSSYLQMRDKFPEWEDTMLMNDLVFVTCGNDSQNPKTFLDQNGTCHDVVLEVHYKATWEGRRLHRVQAVFILVDIPDQSHLSRVRPLAEMKQYFSVSFEHSATKAATCTAGTCSEKQRSPSALSHDGYFLWQPDADGMCQEEPVAASIGESVQTSCWIIVDDEYLQDCAKYRQFLCQRQLTLLDSAKNYTYSRVKGATPLILNSNNSCEDANMNTTNCDSLPTHTIIEVVYADQATVQGATSVYQILGVRIGFQPKSCKPCIGGVDIYCTSANNVEWTGSSIDSVPCTPQKRVLLSSKVQFIAADLNAIMPIKEYWRRVFSSCPGGVCWWQLSEVFAESNYDNQLLADSVQWIVALTAVGLTFLVISCGFSTGIR